MSLLENSLQNVLENNDINSSKLISKLVNVDNKYKGFTNIWESSNNLNLQDLNNNTKIVLKICDILIKNEALLAGGSVLSAFSDFRVHDLDIYVNKKNAINIYKDLFDIGYNDRPDEQIIAPAYDQSFFRKNHILCRFRLLNNNFLPIDLMIIHDDISLLSVVTNFDLSFCEIWFDGQNVYAIDPEGIKNKEGKLKPDYLESLFKYFNRFIIKRIKKYTSRGFNISYASSNCYFLYDRTEIKTINNPNGTIRLLDDDSEKPIYPEEWVVKLVLNKFYKVNSKNNFNIYCNFSLKEFTWQELFSMLKRYYHITPLSYGLYNYIGTTLESIPMPSDYRWTNPASPRFPEDASPEFKQKRVDIKVKLLIKYLILSTLGELFEFQINLDENKNYQKWVQYINIVLNSDLKNDDEKIINSENFFVNFQDYRDIALSPLQTKLLTDILYIENIIDPTYYRFLIPNEEAEGEVIIQEDDKTIPYKEYKDILDNYFITINQRSSISYYKNNYLIPNDFEILDVESYVETTIDEWLSENPSNLVFLYNSTQSDAINGIKGVGLQKNALYQLDSKLAVECKKTGNFSSIKQNDVYIDKIYSLLTIGDSLNDRILLSKLNCVKDEVEKENGNRIFYLSDKRFLNSICSLSNIEFYSNFSPVLNIYGSTISIVSSAHCDEGQQTYVYDEVFIIDKTKLASRNKFNQIISSGVIPREETNIQTQKYNEISSKISNFIDQIKSYTFNDLEDAIIENNSEKVKEIINHLDKDDLNKISIKLDRMTPLIYAASKGYLDIVIELIDNKVELNNYNDEGYTALMYAILNDHPDVVKILIDEEYTNINKQNLYGETALMLAVIKNNLDIVKILMEGSIPNILIKNRNGRTAFDISRDRKYEDITNFLWPYFESLMRHLGNELLEAVIDEDIEAVNRLLDQGVDINFVDRDGNTALIRTIDTSNIEILDLLISRGVDVNFQPNGELNALMEAIIQRKLDIIQKLIDANVNPNLKDNNGYTALQHAEERLQDFINLQEEEVEENENYDSDIQNMRKIITTLTNYINRYNNNNINVIDENGFTPLTRAISSRDIALINRLIEQGADVNFQNSDGYSPLLVAIDTDNINVVNILIERGANVNIQDSDGNTPLIHAIQGIHLDIVKRLIEANVDPFKKNYDRELPISIAEELLQNEIEDGEEHSEIEQIVMVLQNYINRLYSEGESKEGEYEEESKEGEEEENMTIIEAVLSNNINEINRLISEGVDINFQNEEGNTALMIAVETGYKDIVNILLASGADFNLENENGDNAFIIAAFLNNIEMINILIEAGINPNIQDTYGNTALMQTTSIDIINRLLQAGADINIENNVNETALIIASRKDRLEIATILINAGADLNKKNMYQQTALMLAAQGNLIEICELLIERGAELNIKDDLGETALIIAAKNNFVSIVNALINAGADPFIRNDNNNSALEIAQLYQSYTDQEDDEENYNSYEEIINTLQDYINRLNQDNTNETDSGDDYYYDGMSISERMSPRRKSV